MSRSTFHTGEAHQQRASVWVRRRLVDANGRFHAGKRTTDQYGVILADGVGMGKTWEALAASALLLVERSKETQSGQKRLNVRKQPAKILVLCPPGLVSKWIREIREPDGFRKRLEAWTRKQSGRRRFVLDTLSQPYEIRSRHDLEDLPRMETKHKRRQLPGGICVCNWNVFRKEVGSGYSRLAALRQQDWDVVIVDEAHHPECKAAMRIVHRDSKGGQFILLTATPFQLDPKELHALFGLVVDHRQGDFHKVLVRPPVRDFVQGLARFFDGNGTPAPAHKRNAEKHLQQIIARTCHKSRGRKYHAIDANGKATVLEPPPDRRNADSLHKLLDQFITPTREFESWYVRQRMHVASVPNAKRTFVATKLRQALSTRGLAKGVMKNGNGGPPCCPRPDALMKWARSQFEADLRAFACDGWPRKLLVFTSFVASAAEELRQGLQREFRAAWKAVRSDRTWKKMARDAVCNAQSVRNQIEKKLAEPAFAAALQQYPRSKRLSIKIIDYLAVVKNQRCSFQHECFGHPAFTDRVADDFGRRLDVLGAVIKARTGERWQLRVHRDELRSLERTLDSLRSLAIADTYTGHDDVREREASGEAFRSPLLPWVLVASNVGSEGIDLQTYGSHLVHFDLEWNPARMEQREGRIDRVGRRLPGHVNVYYLLVQKTYDERMLHQLMARQRWHSVLLGRPAARLAKDEEGQQDPRLLQASEAQKWMLDLRPGRS